MAQVPTYYNKNNKGGPSYSYCNIVLKIDLGCDSCTQRIRNLILNYPGVMNVEFEGKNKVKVMAQTKVDPLMLRERIQKETLKKTELISPKPPKYVAKKKDNSKDDKHIPKQELQVITVNLKVVYQCKCKGCTKKLRKALSLYKGMHEFNIEEEGDIVKVTGRIEAKKLAEELQKKLRRTVEIANDDNEEKYKDLKYLINNTGCVPMIDGFGRVVPFMAAPQLFSDDNVNACSVM